MRTTLNNVLAALDALRAFPASEFLYDGHSARGHLRRQNLIRYLQLMAETKPQYMLVGEAPGYRGTTVTGVPFMSCREISTIPGLITGSAKGDGFLAPPDPSYETEITSGLMWKILSNTPMQTLPMLWAIFPNHPHQPGDLASNRAPSGQEVRAGVEVVLALVKFLEGVEVVAVGRKPSAHCAKRA